MNTLHSLLRRQVVRFFGSKEAPPPEIADFLSAVDDAYKRSDTDRSMLERSLELSSQELLQANSDMRALFEVLPDLFFRIDETGLILDCKAGRSTDILIPRQSLIGKKIQNVPIPGVGEKFIQGIRELQETKAMVRFEYAITENGTTVFYEARLLPLSDEPQIVVIIQDITRRMEAERALREREELLHATLESTGDGILVVNENGHATHWNNHFLKMWSIPHEVLESANDKDRFLYILKHFRAPDEFITRVNDLNHSREASFDLLELMDGRFIERHSNPLIKDWAIVGRVWSFRDVTERRLAEAAHIQLKTKVERAERLESLGVLAGGVAHDLNNILGPLVGYPELILKKLPDDSPIAKQVSRISKSALEAAGIVQDLLTLARRGRYEMKSLDINEVVSAYLDSQGYLKLTESRSNVKVTCNFYPNLGKISGSTPHLSKVVMNLIVNAFDAMFGAGELFVTTSQRYLDTINNGQTKIEPGEYVVLSVRDTGAGIAPEDLHKVFEPYFSKKKMGTSGSGLGLSVVYGVVKDHKGHVDIFSELRKGTEFVLYFPVIQSEQIVDTPKEINLDGAETILVVDDSVGQREITAELLSSFGYKTIMAEHGHAALDYLKTHQVDLVVLDMIMEDNFDGLDTFKAIKVIYPDQKAIIVSGFSPTDRVHDAMQRGVGMYLKKPFTGTEIARAVRQELNKTKSAAHS